MECSQFYELLNKIKKLDLHIYLVEFLFFNTTNMWRWVYLYNVLSDHMCDCTVLDNDNTYSSNSQIIDFVGTMYFF